jgi:hypothetical protein
MINKKRSICLSDVIFFFAKKMRWLINRVGGRMIPANSIEYFFEGSASNAE